MGKEFTCAKCGRKFTKNRSDEKTVAAAQDQFPGISLDDLDDPAVAVLVCDDCIRWMVAWAQAYAPELIGPDWRQALRISQIEQPRSES